MANHRRLYRKNDWDRVAPKKPSALQAESYRSEARRDYARLIHSPSFRRLQGKTQLFPTGESDFFRNRLTHSLEVAQIAKSIALRLNAQHPPFKKQPLDLDLVEFAALAHDLGHPPFGHTGEAALDRLMRGAGGYEGNAQTLRIISRLEKKQTKTFPSNDSEPSILINGSDQRLGLNLTYRSLASILKYDRPIPTTIKDRKKIGYQDTVCKGYYASEKPLVDDIKKHVVGDVVENFKTVECAIMDVADDIAYSTYDLEDSFKAGFLSPLRMVAMPDSFKIDIAEEIEQKLKKEYDDAPGEALSFSVADLNAVLFRIFAPVFSPPAWLLKRLDGQFGLEEVGFLFGSASQAQSRQVCINGYIRTDLTSRLVGEFIRSVEIIPNDFPQLATVRLTIETFKIVETLKLYSFKALIDSPMLRVAQRRGEDIISEIFERLLENPELLPDDWGPLYSGVDDEAWRKRVLVDYIAGMTDRYCVEFFARLTGLEPPSIHKPF